MHQLVCILLHSSHSFCIHPPPPPPHVLRRPLSFPGWWGGGGHLAQKAQEILGAEGTKEKISSGYTRTGVAVGGVTVTVPRGLGGGQSSLGGGGGGAQGAEGMQFGNSPYYSPCEPW